tara:strand:+ start:171 stop:941 length:771 start_codon:yes stop_codon:yes gene_type:complete
MKKTLTQQKIMKMKKLYVILFTSIFSLNAMAQVEVEQGSFILEMGSNGFKSQSVSSWQGIDPYAWPEDIDGYMNGTNLNMRDAEFGDYYDKYTINSFKLEFGGGYFVIDGLAIGLGFEYSSSSIVIEYTDDAKDIFGEEDYDASNNELIISPGVRYYFGESGVWTSFSYAIATINMDDSEGNYDDAEFPKRSAFNIGVGYAISLNDYVSLNPMIGYNLTTQTTKDNGYDKDGNDVDEVIKSNNFGVGLSLIVHLGY